MNKTILAIIFSVIIASIAIPVLAAEPHIIPDFDGLCQKAEATNTVTAADLICNFDRYLFDTSPRLVAMEESISSANSTLIDITTSFTITNSTIGNIEDDIFNSNADLNIVKDSVSDLGIQMDDMKETIFSMNDRLDQDEELTSETKLKILDLEMKVYDNHPNGTDSQPFRFYMVHQSKLTPTTIEAIAKCDIDDFVVGGGYNFFDTSRTTFVSVNKPVVDRNPQYWQVQVEDRDVYTNPLVAYAICFDATP